MSQFDVLSEVTIRVYSDWDYYAPRAPRLVGQIEPGERGDVRMIYHSFEDWGYKVKLPDGRIGSVAGMLSGAEFRIVWGPDFLPTALYFMAIGVVCLEAQHRRSRPGPHSLTWVSLNFGLSLVVLLLYIGGVI